MAAGCSVACRPYFLYMRVPGFIPGTLALRGPLKEPFESAKLCWAALRFPSWGTMGPAQHSLLLEGSRVVARKKLEVTAAIFL